MSQDIVSDTLNQIINAKKAHKSVLEVNHSCKLLISVLALAKLKGYIKDYKFDKKVLRIQIGKLNECRAIKPRYAVMASEIEKY